MRINVLPASHPASFSGMLFPEVSQSARDWVTTQFQQGSQLYQNVASGMFNHIQSLHQKLNDPNIERMARMLTRGVKGLFHPNNIVPLESVPELQAAKPVMQRYIMAMPMLRELYNQQLCDGYSDSYVDTEPGAVGDNHYDYRRVMNGVVQCYTDSDSKGEFDTFKAVTYFEELHPEDHELEFTQKNIILDAWDLAERALIERIDITDIFGGEIGGE